MITVDVKSSGWGPRRVLAAPRTQSRQHRMELMLSALRIVASLWPRDGVVIIIRRTA